MNALRALKTNTGHLNFGRDLISKFAAVSAQNCPARSVNILDIGCGGQATDLALAAAQYPGQQTNLHGVESHLPSVEQARALGVQIESLDIEQAPLPYPDQMFDLVIANQILEHTKQIFWIIGEVSRVLKPGGGFIVGVPNLASLHNRVLLALGRQPSCITLLGPHVRGFVPGELRSFLQTDGYFNVAQVAGSNFYPFPESLARPLARILPDMAVGMFVLASRTIKPGTFTDVLHSRHYQSEFFSG